MNICLLLFTFCFLSTQVKSVFSVETVSDSANQGQNELIGRVPERPKYECNSNIILIKGNSIKSSSINVAECTSNDITKVHIYVADTFFIDSDLELNGIEELKIFGNTWTVLRNATFDLSGLSGTNQDPPQSRGEAGKPGNPGMDGGDFIGLANEIVNGDRLTINLNGGNGGNGQDGTGSEDIVQTFNETQHIGESAWFSSMDLRNFYERYFTDRHYDAEFNHTDGYTFDVRLHPKCCGRTGMGGEGGLGGRSGKYIFKKTGRHDNASPKFITDNGAVGRIGKTAKACESIALDVRIQTNKKVVALGSVSLYSSFSSDFSIINLTQSEKCSSELVQSNEAIPDLKPPHKRLSIASSVVEFKAFLLENMKNPLLTETSQALYTAIDSNQDINHGYSVNMFASEANELEKYSAKLRHSVDLEPFHKSFTERLKNFRKANKWNMSGDEENAIFTIVRERRNGKPSSGLVVDIENYLHHAIRDIELRNTSLAHTVHINDAELSNNINQLKRTINANYILLKYEITVDAFKHKFFPFAAERLKLHDFPTLTIDDDINFIIVSTTNNLKSLIKDIPMMTHRDDVITQQSSTDPTKSLFVWKYSEMPDKIQRLLKGEKVKFFADIKQSVNRRNALKFGAIDFVIRSSNEDHNTSLNETLPYYQVHLQHSGVSTYRCNDNFYNITTEPVVIIFSLEETDRGDRLPVSYNMVYKKLRDNLPQLSPFTEWEMQLHPAQKSFSRRFPIPNVEADIELHGSAQFMYESDESVCNKSVLEQFYSLV